MAAPQGKRTRPTTERMRESLMSRIGSARGGFQGARVLDAFAGSGMLGLEALSRGAAFCRFCERDRRALAALRLNCKTAPLGADRYAIEAGDVFRADVVAPEGGFDLIFFDPPYDTSLLAITRLLSALADRGALTDDALVSLERRRGDEEASALALERADFEVLSVRELAGSSIALARRVGR